MVLVIIPAFNEEKSIIGVLDELHAELPDADIVVINDCSRDNTAHIVRKKGIPCLDMPFNMGYSAAVQCGFKYAALKGYDFVVQFDGDGQHIAAEAKKLLDTIQQTKADVVIGSRFLQSSGYHHPLFRRIGTAIFRTMIKMACNYTISDPTSGMQVLSKRCFTELSMMNSYPEYPDANLIIELLRKGYRIKEIPVKMRSRTAGVSMHSGIVKPMKYMIVMFYSIFILLLKQRRIKNQKEPAYGN